MKAVVMAGGEGSRLRPLTVGRPKPMVPIVNKPVLGHILDLLKYHGFTEVIITLQYMPTAIQDFFGDGKSMGMKITYTVEESPLGTAGSVRNAAAYLDETFLVISGDALTDFNLRHIVEAHKAKQALATLTLYPVPNPLEYGVIITDEEGHITQFLEKPDWGNVISDRVNTGIYVLEPEVLEMIPKDTIYDFSTQLFPQMLKEKKRLYGHVAEGYWCDVGSIPEYMRANGDLLEGRVHLPTPIGQHLWGGVRVGSNVEIAPDVQIYGQVYLGDSVKIKGGVSIHGPAVIRDYTIVDNHSRIERSILWRNTYVGEACELRGVIVGRQCSIKSGAIAYEGAVIGDNCVLDENSVIHNDVKLWPNKEIEPGATVRRSIIWGSQGRRSLFGKFGVTGVVNVDLTPEFAAKLGSALGAALPQGSYVAVNRDTHRSSRMLKRAMISGLPSAGVHVWDLGTVPIPVARHFIRTNRATSAGVHVRISPYDQRVVDIRFMDMEGMNQSRVNERSIERIFFREDFRRAYLDEIGRIEYAPRPVENYLTDFYEHIDQPRLRSASMSVVVDYSHSQSSGILPKIFSNLGIEHFPLNALQDENKLAVLQDQFHAHLRRMAQIIGVVKADVGVKLDVGGEKIFVVDETGQILDDITTALLMAELCFYAYPDQTLALPVTMPRAFDIVAGWHGVRVIRTKGDLHSLNLASTQPGVRLALDGTGSFIFPDFQPAVDGIMASVRLLEYLTARQMTVSQVVNYLPKVHMAFDQVACPWEAKAIIMRSLNGRYQGEHVETIDGIKIHLSDAEWVHIGPSPERPHFELRAEAEETERATALIAEYSQIVRDLVTHHHPSEF